MVDADAIEDAFVEPVEDAAVGGVEDVRPLDAHADEGVDIEEATIAEFLIGGAPVSESIVLLIEKLVERVVTSSPWAGV